MSRFRIADDFKKTIDACHLTHNVPDFRNPDGGVDTKNTLSASHIDIRQVHSWRF